MVKLRKQLKVLFKGVGNTQGRYIDLQTPIQCFNYPYGVTEILADIPLLMLLESLEVLGD